MAIVDGSIVGSSGTTPDTNSNATDNLLRPTYSWTGTAYQLGSAEKKLAISVAPVTPP